jgi:hypothetical protein
MPDISKLVTEIAKIETLFKRQGMWRTPTPKPPQIHIDDNWDDNTRGAAEVCNRIWWVRSLPDFARLFGSVRAQTVMSFQYDYPSASDKLNFAKNQLNLLIMDMKMVPRIDTSQLNKVEN